MFFKLIPFFLLAFTYQSSNGVHWELDVPPGWHIIDSPEGLADGIHLRFGSSPTMTSENPMPQTGEAMIAIEFTKGHKAETITIPSYGTMTTTNYPNFDISVWNNGNTSTDAATKAILDSIHEVKP